LSVPYFMRAQHFDGQRRKIAHGASMIERGSKVRRGVGKGAVQIEQSGFSAHAIQQPSFQLLTLAHV
jgi:hypothetical protein